MSEQQEQIRKINPKIYHFIWMLYTVDEREVYEKLYEIEKKLHLEYSDKLSDKLTKTYETYETFIDYQLECNLRDLDIEVDEDEYMKEFNLINLGNTLEYMADIF